MKLEKILVKMDIADHDVYLEKYVISDFDLKILLIGTFQAGASRALNMNDDSLSIKNYINNLFKD